MRNFLSKNFILISAIVIGVTLGSLGIRLMKTSQPKFSMDRVAISPENSVFVAGKVTPESVQGWIEKVNHLHATLPESHPIIMIIQSPGGSVFAGYEFINHVKSTGRPLVGVAVRAYSMGFHFLQASDHRVVVEGSIIMNHNVSTGGVGGVVRGTLKGQEIFNESLQQQLDEVAYGKAKVDVDVLKELALKDHFMVASDAIKFGFADELAHPVCVGEYLGSVEKEMNFLIFSVVIKQPKCPLRVGAVVDRDSFKFKGNTVTFEEIVYEFSKIGLQKDLIEKELNDLESDLEEGSLYDLEIGSN
jgi:ATP-dependent protease ClpP protease subunit